MDREIKEMQLKEVKLRIQVAERQLELCNLQEQFFKGQIELNKLAKEAQKKNIFAQLGEKFQEAQKIADKTAKKEPPEGLVT